jgi:diguanylate cyclase (GGDEF)-like protein
MRFGIAAKLALLLALVGFLAAGVTGFYAYRASRDLLVDAAQNKLLTSTQVLARRITLTRQEISRTLEVLAHHPAAMSTLQHPDAALDDQLATLFQLQMQANPSYSQLRLISASDFGLERVRVDRSNGAVARVQGDNLQEKGHYTYVAETLKLPAGSTYLSPITINREAGSDAGRDLPMLQQAMPVVDAEGNAVGVVVVNVDLNGMFGLLSADLPAAYKVFLANSEGDILVHPDNSKTFGFERGRRMLVQDEFLPTLAVVQRKQDQVVFEDRDGDYAGTPVVAAFIAQSTRLSANESRLILGVAQPLEQVLAQSQQLGATVVKIVVGLCLACLLLAIVLARVWTRPINQMTVAAQRLANGLPPEKLPLQSRDEIGLLARSFHKMHTQITQQLADLKDNQEELEHLAQHDMLTGLPNRRLFQERLEQALAHARRYQQQVCLFFIDLDAFKAINDRHGHEAGDVVLVNLAQRMLSLVREVDTVARLGGDEFVVLLGAAVPDEDLIAIAEKLLNGIKQPMTVRGKVLQLTASIGISRYPQDGQTAGELLSSADKAMYEVKGSGRDSFHQSSILPL